MIALFRRVGFTAWIFIGIGIGTLIGWLDPALGEKLRPLSTTFLRMIKMIVIPILITTLIMGIAGHGDDLKRIGRLAIKSFVYFWIMTAAALIIGLVAVSITEPGIGVRIPPPDPHSAVPAPAPRTVTQFIEHIVPVSLLDAAARNEVLQIVFWSTLFGIALAQVPGKPKQAVLAVVEGIMEAMFKFVSIVMKFAPFGIGAAIAVTVSHSGIEVLKNLGMLVLTLYVALAVFAIVALVPAALIAKIPIKRFIRHVKDPAIVAFTTTSSDAALPMAIQRMISFGVPKKIVAFVMPTGYSFNLDGSTLYLGVASLFVAQAAGMNLAVGEMVALMITLLITSKGIAGVPRASLVVLAGILPSFGMPIEGVAVVLGVDELLDMGRTMVNLVGNCLATAVMGRWEGELDDRVLQGEIPAPDAAEEAS